MSDNAFVLIIVLTLSLAFCGEPDIQDAVVHNLMNDCEPTVTAVDIIPTK